jgi:hypothetical protein
MQKEGYGKLKASAHTKQSVTMLQLANGIPTSQSFILHQISSIK